MTKPRIVIVMDGGVIQNIITDHPDMDVRTIDYDVEEHEGPTTSIPQLDRHSKPNGETEEAVLCNPLLDQADSATMDLYFRLELSV